MAVNVEFFKKESPELAYILGLWASDGCIYENRMQLQMNDYDVIEWVARTVGFTGEIKEVKLYKGFDIKTDEVSSIGYLIRFRSNEIRDIFNRYGITAKKSLTIDFPKLPSELIENIIRHSSNEGDIVLDCFLGSGTTAVAAINSNRQFIGIERETEYVEIGNRRIAEALVQRGD
jgi:adenine specific DNA methylase Mod